VPIHVAEVEVDNGDKEEVTRTSSVEDEATGFARRFPWFGSMSRGKTKEKKEKRSSQFYSGNFETENVVTVHIEDAPPENGK